MNIIFCAASSFPSLSGCPCVIPRALTKLVLNTNWTISSSGSSSSRPSKISPCKRAHYNNKKDNPTPKNMPASSILRVFTRDVYFNNLKLITYDLEKTKQRVSLMTRADWRRFERRYGVFRVTTRYQCICSNFIPFHLLRSSIRRVAFGVRGNGKLSDVAGDKDRWSQRLIKCLRGGRSPL